MVLSLKKIRDLPIVITNVIFYIYFFNFTKNGVTFMFKYLRIKQILQIFVWCMKGVSTMKKTVAYLRVSADSQDLNNQRYEILDYANRNGFSVDHWIGIKISSRKSTKERLIDQLLQNLQDGDCLIVAELSRLGRSVGQIITIMDELIKKQVRTIIIKQGMIINGKNDIQTKTMITMFSLFAEIERDLISERTKSGLARARAEGKLIGRPRGNGKSRLDGKEEEIKELLRKKVSRSSIARIMNVSWPTLHHFMKTRSLYAPI